MAEQNVLMPPNQLAESRVRTAEGSPYELGIRCVLDL
jgi:hypothetical protein